MIRFLLALLMIIVALWYNPQSLAIAAPVALFMPVLAAGNVYWRSSATNAMQVTAVVSQSDWSTGTTTAYSNTVRGIFSWCLDHLNAELFEVDSSNVFYRRSVSSTGSRTGIGFTASANVIAVACDPTNERVFYMQLDTANQVRVVNYDGSGDTAIAGWSTTTTTGSARYRIIYDQTLDRVYYMKDDLDATGMELRYVGADGTGDTLYASLASSKRSTAIAIDKVNRYVFWRTAEFPDVGLRRGNMDGSGVTTLNYHPDNDSTLTFSHLLGKLHYCYSNSYTRCNNDGSSEENIDTSGGALIQPNHHIALGEGLEEMGAGAVL